jgi:hypothetical protein
VLLKAASHIHLVITMLLKWKSMDNTAAEGIPNHPNSEADETPENCSEGDKGSEARIWS